MRKHYEDGEKRRLVKEWDESGLSAAAFGELRGINRVSLAAWGRAIRGPLRKRSRSRPVAREVEVVEVAGPSPAGVRVELELRKDRRLVVSGAVTAEMIAELIVAFESVASS